MKNKFFPCHLVKHTGYSSMVTSDFHYFDDCDGVEIGGGYDLEKLAKKLIRENNLPKGLKFDSEAGMFCAYSNDEDLLLGLCKLFRQITGEEGLHKTKEIKLSIPYEEAEQLLLKAYVEGLDESVQQAFLKQVPIPFLSKKQKEYVDAIASGTNEEKIHAAKKINAEARTKTRSLNNYFSHPSVITMILKAIDETADPKVYQELLWALVFIADARHYTDLRVRPYFFKALNHKLSQIRFLGLLGLGSYEYSREAILPLTKDPSKKVSDKAIRLLNEIN